MKRILQRIVQFWRRAADKVPPTWRGTLVAVLASLALWRYGFGDLDLVLFAISVLALGLVFVTSLAVGATALRWRSKIVAGAAESRRLEAGGPVRTGFRAPAFARMPLVRVGWEWVEPAGVEVRLKPRESFLQEEVVATSRGQVGHLRRRFTVEDVFALARVAWERDQPTALTILPHVGRLRGLPSVLALAGGETLPHPVAGTPEGDRMEIRPYTPGDSVRNILWKTFARTRQLNVRTPERSVERARKTIAYLVTGPEDEAAAAAARVTLETGELGEDWLFGADGTSEPASRLEPALEAIARSGSFERNGSGGGLAEFLHAAGRDGEAHCLVFAPPHPGPWTDEVVEAARAYPGLMSFVVGTDGVVRPKPVKLWRRLLFADQPEPGTPADELAAILRVLSGTGSPTLVLDRANGRSYTEAHQRLLGGQR